MTFSDKTHQLFLNRKETYQLSFLTLKKKVFNIINP